MSPAPASVAGLLSQHSDALASDLETLLKAFKDARLGDTIVVSRQGLAALGRVRAFCSHLRSEVEAASGPGSARRQAVEALDQLETAFRQAERVLAARATFPRELAKRSLRNAQAAASALEQVARS